MTVIEALAEAAVTLDVMVGQRERAQAAQMFLVGCSGEEISAVQYLQRVRDQKRRIKALADVEATLRPWEGMDDIVIVEEPSC
jgi:hypothetical protein